MDSGKMGKLMVEVDELATQEPLAAYRATVPLPSKPTTAEKGLIQKNQVLNTALGTVRADRLRRIVKDLCLVSDTAEKYISNVLLTPDGNVNPEAKRKRSAADENTEASNDNKRMRIRYAMCTQCDREFDVTVNYGKACRYHPGQSTVRILQLVTLTSLTRWYRIGYREADYSAEVWADHDENCHGRISDLEEECPEGYEWTCCERSGDKEGCKRGPHRERVMEADEESDENVSSDTDLEDGGGSHRSEEGDE